MDGIPSRPPTTRMGKTYTLKVEKITMQITANRNAEGQIIEVFAKAVGGDGIQGHVDRVCTMASLAIQAGCPIIRIIQHLKGDQTHPRGFVGQPSSVYAAIAKVLEQEMEEAA